MAAHVHDLVGPRHGQDRLCVIVIGCPASASPRPRLTVARSRCDGKKFRCRLDAEIRPLSNPL